MRGTPSPYLMLAAVALFWGGNVIAGKLAVGHVSPMLLTTLRWMSACLIMAPFAWTPLRREWPRLRSHLPFLITLGAFGFTAFNALLYVALNYTSAINGTIEQAAMPLVVFLANFILFRTKVEKLQIAGFALTLVGVALTASHGDPRRLLALDFNRGDALMMIAVVIYGGFTVALRYKPELDWRTTIFVLSAAAFVTSIPVALVEYAAAAMILPDSTGLAVVLYTAVFPSLLAQTLYIAGVSAIGPNRANLFINLVPVFGAALAVAMLGEAFHGYHLAAMIFVLGGIAIAERAVQKGRPILTAPGDPL